MSKNIVVCCDGTANEFAKDKTNVIKLYATLVQDPARQVSYYHPGIGTMEHPGAWTDIGRKFTRLLGMAVGFGLENDIADVYVYLMRNYEPGDKLFLFGFSRGSYTVRAVASLLHMYGLIRQGNDTLAPYAIRMLTSVSSNKRVKNQRAAAAFELAKEFRGTFCSVDCKPWFVGVWDTVSSVGWVQNPLKLPYLANNPDIAIGRHAVSIDEHRAFFRTNLWRSSDSSLPSGPRDVKQVWFPGVHCDVGGGYPEPESGLAKIALEWMLAEAVQSCLLVDPDKRREILGETDPKYVRPNPTADSHESLTWKWYAAELIPKRHYDYKTKKQGWRMNLFRRRKMPDGAWVHESAFQRGDTYRKRLPKDAVMVKTGSAAAAAPC
jgi:uncharacterized protein (DUF2235 family)